MKNLFCVKRCWKLVVFGVAPQGLINTISLQRDWSESQPLLSLLCWWWTGGLALQDWSGKARAAEVRRMFRHPLHPLHPATRHFAAPRLNRWSKCINTSPMHYIIGQLLISGQWGKKCWYLCRKLSFNINERKISVKPVVSATNTRRPWPLPGMDLEWPRNIADWWMVFQHS